MEEAQERRRSGASEAITHRKQRGACFPPAPIGAELALSFSVDSALATAVLDFGIAHMTSQPAEVEVNGTVVGYGTPDLSESCEPTAHFSADIEESLHLGNNILVVRAGAGASQLDDIWVTDILIEGTRGDPQYEILSVAKDRDYYINGETAEITVRVRNNWGDPNFQLSGELEYFGEFCDLGSQSVAVPAGSETSVSFFGSPSYAEYPRHFEFKYTLSSGSTKNLITGTSAQFATYSLEGREIPEEAIAAISECNPNDACFWNIVAVVPAIGLGGIVVAHEENACLVAQYRAEGKNRQADIIGLTSSLFVTKAALKSASTAATLFNLTIRHALHYAAIIPSLFTATIVCESQLGDWMGWNTTSKSSQYMIHDMADSLLTVSGDMTIDYSAFVLSEGDCEIRVLADSLWTSADSLGLRDVYVAKMDSLGAACAWIGTDPMRLDNPDSSDNAACTVEVRAAIAQDVPVAIVHNPDFAPAQVYKYVLPMAGAQSVAWIELARNRQVPAFRIDQNGDGVIDEYIAPLAASDASPVMAVGARLYQSHPNPFNPQTTIAYDLPTQEAVSLRVYDVAGRLVRVLVDGEVTDPGRHESIWNGRDDTGRRVASGTYFYRIEAGEYSETKRMALIK